MILDFESKALDEVREMLTDMGFKNGNAMSEKEISSESDIVFYQGEVTSIQGMKKTFVSYDIIPVMAGQYSDNLPRTAFITTYIDLLTPLKDYSPMVMQYRRILEKEIEKHGYSYQFNGSEFDDSLHRWRISYDVRKIYG